MALDGALDAIARSVLDRPRAWSAGIVLTATVALLVAAGLRVDLRPTDFFPSTRGESALDIEAVRERFGVTDPLVAGIRGDGPLDLSSLGPPIETLAASLGRLPQVRRVVYRVREPLREYLETGLPARLVLYLSEDELHRYAARLDPETMAGLLAQIDTGVRSWIPVTSRVERSDPLAYQRLLRARVRDWKGGFRIAFRDGYFTSPDGTQLFLMLEPVDRISSGADAVALLESVEEVLAEFRAGSGGAYSTTLAGRARIVAWGFESLLADARRAVTGSLLFVFAVLLLFFRSVVIPAAIVATVGFALVVTAAGARVFAGEVNLFALLFSAVLVGIGIDFCIHIANAYAHQPSVPSRSPGGALSRALRSPGRGIVFGAVTTSAAFLALTASDYRGLAQIGALTGGGLLVVLAASLTVFPLLLSRVQPGRRSPPLLRGLRRVFGAISTRPRLVLMFWAVCGAVALAGLPRLEYEPHPWNAAVRGNPRTAELERLASELGSHLTPLLVVSEAGTREDALAMDRRVAATIDRVRDEAGVAFFRSITALLPDIERQRSNLDYAWNNPALFSAERFRHNFGTLLDRHPGVKARVSEAYTDRIAGVLEGIGELQPVTIETLRESGLGPEIDRHLARIGDRFVAVTYVYLDELPWSGAAVSTFLEAFEGAGGGELEGVHVTGEATRSLGHARVLDTEALRAATLAFAAILLVLGVEFRNPRRVALAMLPLFSAVLITLGVIGWLRIPVTFLTIAVTPILLGIGIDDALHVIEREARGEDWREILAQAGGGITITSITTIGAFLALCLSSHPAVVEFASVTALGILLCWLSSLTLLPVLLRAGH